MYFEINWISKQFWKLLFSLNCHNLTQNHPNFASWGCFGNLRTYSWWWPQKFWRLMHPWRFKACILILKKYGANCKWMNMNCMKTCGICGGSYLWRKQHRHVGIQWGFSECRDAGFAVYSMRIHPDLKVLNTVHEANWEACKENCDNVNKLCRNFIYDVRSFWCI